MSRIDQLRDELTQAMIDEQTAELAAERLGDELSALTGGTDAMSAAYYAAQDHMYDVAEVPVGRPVSIGVGGRKPNVSPAAIPFCGVCNEAGVCSKACPRQRAPRPVGVSAR